MDNKTESTMRIQFGTDGIRGNASQPPFTPDTLGHLGHAIAFWSIKKYKKKAPHVLFISDTRASCTNIKRGLATALATHDILISDAGILPTPAALYLTQTDRAFDFSIVVSASHNTHEDNGIKLFGSKHGKLARRDERTIEHAFYKYASTHKQHLNLKELTYVRSIATQAKKRYIDYVTSFFKRNIFAHRTIVLDCANGSTYETAPAIFKALGAHVISLATQPNGTNINQNCGALYPQALSRAVIEHNADAGFAFDGDGDRVVMVTRDGTIKDGDDILALLLYHPRFQHTTKLVGTVMTNHGLATHLKEMEKQLVRTKVGDKHISAYLEKHNLLLGGEASGHIIMADYLLTGDGIATALTTLEGMILNNNEVGRTFEKLPQITVNVPVAVKNDLEQEPYQTLIARHEQTISNGRVIVRYSGTEDLLRVMAESNDFTQAQKAAKNLAKSLQKALLKSREVKEYDT